MMPHIHGRIVSAQAIQPQNVIVCDFGDEYPSCQWTPPQEESTNASFKMEFSFDAI
jgi:hypothetical protein